jgi:Domain of unknown function (DUF397)
MADKRISNIVWRKSTASSSRAAVEVAFSGDSVLVRNSSDPSGLVMSFAPSEWRAFLDGATRGEFNLGEEETPEPETDTEIAVTIFLSNESAHEQVEEAVEEFLASVGIEIEIRDDPISGSWFRSSTARVTKVTDSVALRKAAITAEHTAEARLVLAQDAATTAMLGQIVAPIIASLQDTQEAVIRVHALLIVKFDGKITVHQLTTVQQYRMNRQPQLAQCPDRILSELELGEGGL